MPKIFLGSMMIFLPVLVLAQAPCTPAAYQIATIIDAKPLPSPESSSLDERLYEISMSVGQTVYAVLAPSPSLWEPIPYAAGRQLRVRVGDGTITWNDNIGQCYKSPIIGTSQIHETSRPQG
jgi:hypothetical protein